MARRLALLAAISWLAACGSRSGLLEPSPFDAGPDAVDAAGDVAHDAPLPVDAMPDADAAPDAAAPDSCGGSGLAPLAPWPMFQRCPTHIGRSEHAVPLDVVERWRFVTNGAVRSQPVIDASGSIYVTTWFGTLHAISPSGEGLWQVDLGAQVDTTPALATDGSVIVAADASVRSFSTNGALVWITLLDAPTHSSPAIGSDGTIYVTSGSSLLALASNDGSVKWKAPLENMATASPAIALDGTVRVGDQAATYPDGSVKGGKLYAFAASGASTWSFATGGHVYSAPALSAEGTAFFGSYSAVWAVRTDGTASFQHAVVGQVLASPSLNSEGSVYLGASGNLLLALAPDGSEQWSFGSESYAESTAAVDSAGHVFVAGKSQTLYVLDWNGAMLTSRDLGAEVKAGPSIGSDGSLYVGTEAGELVAFGPAS
jgi:PQQ-like domain